MPNKFEAFDYNNWVQRLNVVRQKTGISLSNINLSVSANSIGTAQQMVDLKSAILAMNTQKYLKYADYSALSDLTIQSGQKIALATKDSFEDTVVSIEGICPNDTTTVTNYNTNTTLDRDKYLDYTTYTTDDTINFSEKNNTCSTDGTITYSEKNTTYTTDDTINYSNKNKTTTNKTSNSVNTDYSYRDKTTSNKTVGCIEEYDKTWSFSFSQTEDKTTSDSTWTFSFSVGADSTNSTWTFSFSVGADTTNSTWTFSFSVGADTTNTTNDTFSFNTWTTDTTNDTNATTSNTTFTVN